MLVKQMETMAAAKKEMADVDAMDKAVSLFTLSKFKNVEGKLTQMGISRHAYHLPKREDDVLPAPLSGSQRANQASATFLKKKPAVDAGGCGRTGGGGWFETRHTHSAPALLLSQLPRCRGRLSDQRLQRRSPWCKKRRTQCGSSSPSL